MLVAVALGVLGNLFLMFTAVVTDRGDVRLACIGAILLINSIGFMLVKALNRKIDEVYFDFDLRRIQDSGLKKDDG